MNGPGRAATCRTSSLVNYDGPAPHEELEGLIAAVDDALIANGYYNPVKGRADAARLTMRNLFTRPQFSAGEVRTLRGIVRRGIDPDLRPTTKGARAGWGRCFVMGATSPTPTPHSTFAALTWGEGETGSGANGPSRRRRS